MPIMRFCHTHYDNADDDDDDVEENDELGTRPPSFVSTSDQFEIRCCPAEWPPAHNYDDDDDDHDHDVDDEDDDEDDDEKPLRRWSDKLLRWQGWLQTLTDSRSSPSSFVHKGKVKKKKKHK